MQRKNGDVSTVHWRALPFLLEPKAADDVIEAAKVTFKFAGSGPVDC
jgi:hypothetical protein